MRVVELQELIKAELQHVAGEMPAIAEVVRGYHPRDELERLGDCARIIVAPDSLSSARETRAYSIKTVSARICLLKKLSSSANTTTDDKGDLSEFDALIGFSEWLMEFFVPSDGGEVALVSAGRRYQVAGATFEPVYNDEFVTSHGVYQSVLKVEFQMLDGRC